MRDEQIKRLLQDAARERYDELIKAEREHEDKIKAINRAYDDRMYALLAEQHDDQPQDMLTGDQVSDT